MLTERTELTAVDGGAEALGAVLAGDLKDLLLSVPGVLSVQSGRGVENPERYILLVGWETMAAHAAFSASEASPRLRGLLAGKIVHGAMEHFEIA